MTEGSGAPAGATGRTRTAALAFIFVTVAPDMLAFGLVLPVTPRLIEVGMAVRGAQFSRDGEPALVHIGVLW